MKLPALFRSLSLTQWVVWGLGLLQLLAILGQGWYFKAGPNVWPFVADGKYYYSYLPAALIHHDLEWINQLPGEPEITENFDLKLAPESGKYVNKYALGVAVLQAPFFLVGHEIAVFSSYPADGFSPPYRLLIMLATVFYAFIGLFFLRKLLLLFYSEWVTAVTLVTLSLGTNLLYYTVFEGGMSHVYSFFAMAMAMYCTLVWHRDGKLKQMLGLALSCGLIILIRPSNGLFLIFPLLYGAFGLEPFGGWRGKLDFWKKHRRQLLIGLGIGFLTLLPQMLYWKAMSGDWIFYSYGDEGFIFSEPAIFKVLLSYRKGWFIYSPLMLLSIMGLVWLPRYVKGASIPLLLFLLINVYVVSSWWSWWYGGSFGMRALTEMAAPLSLGLAALLAQFSSQKLSKIALSALLALLIGLNLIMTYQYKNNLMHWSDMSKDVYWKLFLRPRIPAEELEQIHQYLEPVGEEHRRRLELSREK